MKPRFGVLFLALALIPSVADAHRDHRRRIRPVETFPQGGVPEEILRAGPVRLPDVDEVLESPRGPSGELMTYDLLRGVEGREERVPYRGDPLPDDRNLLGGGFYPGEDEPVREDGGEKASALIKVSNTTPYPWRTIGALRMRFGSNWSSCTGETTGSFHILTAGHCIFNWDPNDDGDTSDRQWADEVRFYPGQTDLYAPIGTADLPYGEARGVYLRSYAAWTQHKDFAHDWGVVTLDRRVGDRVGWMGRTSSIPDSLNIGGYPREAEYGYGSNLFLWRGYDPDNVGDVGDEIVEVFVLGYGGMSGGPLWRYRADSGERHIAAVNSGSNRKGRVTGTRLTDEKRDDLNGYMYADGLVRPPVARPDLRQYDESYSDILGTVVAQGATLTVDYDVVNMGYAGSGTVTVDFYLSTNTTITTGDRYIGTRTIGSLNPFQYANPRAAFSIASNTPLGTYYVGWIMSCPTTEYTTSNNAAVITEETMQIIEPVECGTARTTARSEAAAVAALGLVLASLLARRRRARD